MLGKPYKSALNTIIPLHDDVHILIQGFSSCFETFLELKFFSDLAVDDTKPPYTLSSHHLATNKPTDYLEVQPPRRREEH